MRYEQHGRLSLPIRVLLVSAVLLVLTGCDSSRPVYEYEYDSVYLKDLAAKTAAGTLDFARLSKLPDEEVIEHLTQVKGIGVWTAQMFLMFSLKRENVLPTGDFGVRMAMYKHYLDMRRAKAAKTPASSKKGRKKKIKLPTPKQMEKIAKCWEPYRSVACWYLWRSLDIKTL